MYCTLSTMWYSSHLTWSFLQFWKKNLHCLNFSYSDPLTSHTIYKEIEFKFIWIISFSTKITLVNWVKEVQGRVFIPVKRNKWDCKMKVMQCGGNRPWHKMCGWMWRITKTMPNCTGIRKLKNLCNCSFFPQCWTSSAIWKASWTFLSTSVSYKFYL